MTAALTAWLTLLRAPGIGSVTAHRLIEHFGSPTAVLAASGAQLQNHAGLSAAQVRALLSPDAALIAQDLAWQAQPDRTILSHDDPRYPETLRQIHGAPALLFVHGDPDWLSMPQIAIVGARSATAQGLENAKAFAHALAQRGLVITSGLALGIDGAAHQGALQADAATVAVCATGLDRVYPARHRDLATAITRNGALVSEFVTGTPARAENFPRRNRIISGLAMGVLVVEATRDSGSLITARLALEQGREVLAIPGSIHNPMARGCHQLIRQGAKLVETVDDVLEEIGPRLGLLRQRARPGTAATATTATPPAADAATRALLAALGDDPVDVDTLAARTGQPLPELQTALTLLELSGDLAVGNDGRYQRIVHPFQGSHERNHS
ncbi:DNA-processing protein DprA [Sinimarinibacterium sp. NLF-5-8]|uniref:DNA-processing protein DprA n=1 Tax=Sinimarinibacterium sp. NLF-5-8 TaxID=2698684 RepID=UPI00137BA974|nr:DNA-processing protein DprA [Sinimarinibacterium sp. NLF-5-8]QHS10639.1 DNA-protecting protein DprA [Sinimarinibacterium sp. NLF-5-8]